MVTPLPQINNINIEKVEYFNFLGLTLDTHLNWKNHANNVANKCSRTIGVLNRLKYTLPLRIKIMLYNTLIIYHVNYCIMVLGYQQHRIDKLLKKALRIITLSKFHSHTAPLFKQCNLLMFKDVLEMHELKCYHKLIHNKLPAYLLTWNIIPNTSIHNHSTRRCNEIHIIGTRHDFAKRCLKNNLANTLNKTLQTVKDKLVTHSLQGFANYAKQITIQNYNVECSIANCYSCLQTY